MHIFWYTRVGYAYMLQLPRSSTYAVLIVATTVLWSQLPRGEKLHRRIYRDYKISSMVDETDACSGTGGQFHAQLGLGLGLGE